MQDRLKTMEERRDAQGDLMLAFLADAQAHGAHVYRPDELYPDVNWTDPDTPKPRLDPTELVYLYGGVTYQVIFNGRNVYHLATLGTAHSPRPYRRCPPQPHAPWHRPEP